MNLANRFKISEKNSIRNILSDQFKESEILFIMIWLYNKNKVNKLRKKLEWFLNGISFRIDF